VKIEFLVFWTVSPGVWWLDTNVSDDRAASIFREAVHRNRCCNRLRFLTKAIQRYS